MPVSTYRLQMAPSFTLDRAREIVPYLAALGVTDCYVSPVFAARPGSTHGYDVTSHTAINPELGGEPAFIAFAESVAAHGMGLLLDFVPNHMSNDPQTNEWWRDVLENGPSSPYAECFDIDWDPVKPELKERLLLPILAEPYGEALETGRLQLRYGQGRLTLTYGDQEIPINPRRAPLVLEGDLAALEAACGPDDPHHREFLSVLTALRNLPPYTERDPRRIAERQREKEVARERLQRVVEDSPAVRDHVLAAVARANGQPGDPGSFDRLHGLLELQAYRIASWRTAAEEINFRRFFDINELAGLRVERPRVFEDIHRLVFRFVREGRITGLRLDHIDGLFDPAGYLDQLQRALADARAGRGGGAFYVVVEKILSGRETLPASWPVAGTTGYEFLNELNGIFVASKHALRMRRIYAQFTGQRAPFADAAYDGKRLIAASALSSDLQVLSQAINRLSERDRWSRDFTQSSIRRALREVVACFPVYRAYVSPAGTSATDIAVVDAAIREARWRNPAMETSIFDFLRTVLLPDQETWRPGQAGSIPTAARLEVAMRIQQYTAPVQAKGVEDTAFYRHHALVSLNEVGGDPGRFGRPVHEFHAANAARLARRPLSMLATTTHDTKRSEDARARINVLSEQPGEWRGAVARWRRVNARNRSKLQGGPVPDGNDEYLFYQVLMSTWPPESMTEPIPERASDDLTARLRAFMRKAIKEAKIHTSWITPNEAYEAGVDTFVERTLQGPTARAFLDAFVPMARRVAQRGLVGSLAQLVLKLVSPGVPDFYQGTELWDYGLVDPDNRRPVDYVQRAEMLQALEPLLAGARIGDDGGLLAREAPVGAEPPGGVGMTADVAALVRDWPDGRIKLLVTACGLRARRAYPALFIRGEYVALAAEGPHAEHVVACARVFEEDVLVAIVPRLTSLMSPLPLEPALPLGDIWDQTAVRLPEVWQGRTFRHLATGERVRVVTGAGPGAAVIRLGDALHVLPVALLWSPAARNHNPPA